MRAEALATILEKKLDLSTGGLRDFRLTHLELYKQKGLRGSDPEAYRFTNLERFFEALQYAPEEPAEAPTDSFRDEAFFTLVFVDGEWANPKLRVPGVSFSSIPQSFAEVSPLLKEDDPTSHLHHALLSGGVLVSVAKQTRLEKPLRLVNLTTRSGITAPTVVVKAGPFAEFVILEENHDQGAPHAGLSETYVFVEAGARVEHVQLVQQGPEALFHSSTRCRIDRDGHYRNVLVNLRGKLSRRNLCLELLSPGAHAESYNLYLTSGQEHSDISTVIHHRAADTTSNQIAKGILDGDSKGIFTGKIHIHPDAQRVASAQLNKNLLLSSKAQAHSQPQLEIFADDVKCSHGSTTGQLSPDEVFYFEARGIPASRAKTLLAHGFALEVVLKIQSGPVRRVVEDQVLAGLREKFSLGANP